MGRDVQSFDEGPPPPRPVKSAQTDLTVPIVPLAHASVNRRTQEKSSFCSDLLGRLGSGHHPGCAFVCLPSHFGRTMPDRFVVDDMLSRLARWLRVLGYDTVAPRPVEDVALVRLALRDGRVLLTQGHLADAETTRRPWRAARGPGPARSLGGPASTAQGRIWPGPLGAASLHALQRAVGGAAVGPCRAAGAAVRRPDSAVVPPVPLVRSGILARDSLGTHGAGVTRGGVGLGVDAWTGSFVGSGLRVCREARTGAGVGAGRRVRATCV